MQPASQRKPSLDKLTQLKSVANSMQNDLIYVNKANLRDLIAATSLVILLKLDSNRRFFAHVTLKFDG